MDKKNYMTVDDLKRVSENMNLSSEGTRCAMIERILKCRPAPPPRPTCSKSESSSSSSLSSSSTSSSSKMYVPKKIEKSTQTEASSSSSSMHEAKKSNDQSTQTSANENVTTRKWKKCENFVKVLLLLVLIFVCQFIFHLFTKVEVTVNRPWFS